MLGTALTLFRGTTTLAAVHAYITYCHSAHTEDFLRIKHAINDWTTCCRVRDNKTLKSPLVDYQQYTAKRYNSYILGCVSWSDLWFVLIWACVSTGILETGGGNTHESLSSALHFMSEHLVQCNNQIYRDTAWFEILSGQCFFTESLYTQLSYSHMVLFIHHCLNMEISWKLTLLTLSRYWGFRRVLHLR